MSKKFLPVLLVLTVAGLFLCFKTLGKTDDDNPKSRFAKVLRNLGMLLEQGHYSPKKIDDAFSKDVFKRFTETLDDDKNIFLQSDIDSFKVYETKIDDEIHGSTLKSFYVINEKYINRLNEVSEIFKSVLSKPFDFNKDESVMLDGTKLNFSKTVAEREEQWRKRLKYLVLSRYADMLTEREKNKDTKDYKFKADTTLEREAREQVNKQMTRYFATKKTHDNTNENFTTFVNAITNTMDPHTDYFAPVDKRSFDESMSGKFYGIGAQLKEDDGKIKIASLVSGGPAWKSGDIKENDEIIKIAQGNAEPVDVSGYAVPDAVKLIRGAEKGSEVRITLRKVDGTIKVVALKRDEIKLEDTFAKSAVINGTNKIGYIYLPEFYADFNDPKGARCADDVAKEVKKLKAENVDGIVLDLRGNGGGSLYDVVQMAGLFIEDGPICQVKGRDEKANVLKDKDRNVLYSGPLAVMVDETSASASEIFAAAIQDYKRGVIVGSNSTYGKGTVQRNIPLNPEEPSIFSKKKSEEEEDLGFVKLTLQKFYRINGGATQLKGVTPDVIFPDRLDYLKIREKDNPDALKWDEISKADYKLYNTNLTEAAIAAANKKAGTSTSFNIMKQNLDWLAKTYDREYSLNLKKFQAEQKTIKETFKQIDQLSKLQQELPVTNIKEDEAAATASDKKDKNKLFLKRISEDAYIGQTLEVLATLIEQNKTATAAKLN